MLGFGALKQDIQADIEKHRQRLKEQAASSLLAIPIHIALGRLHERAGDIPEAIQEFAAAALLYADHGNIAKAMAAAKMITRLEPGNDELFARLEELYVLRNSVTDAHLQAYQESLSSMETAAIEPETPQQAAPSAQTVLDIVAALRQIPLFAKLSVSELRGVEANSTLRQFAANEQIVMQDHAAKSLFVIIAGEIRVSGKDNDLRDTCLGILSVGQTFGELALFDQRDPSISLYAEQESLALDIPLSLFLKIARTRPEMLEMLKTQARHRLLELALARVSFLRRLPLKAQRDVIAHFKPINAEKDTVLILEGAPCTTTYFLASGEIGVYTSLLSGENEETSAESDRISLATLKSGDFFGEQALFSQEPSSATMIAQTDVTLFAFSQDDLSDILQKYPEAQSVLNRDAFHEEQRKKLARLNQH